MQSESVKAMISPRAIFSAVLRAAYEPGFASVIICTFEGKRKLGGGGSFGLLLTISTSNCACAKVWLANAWMQSGRRAQSLYVGTITETNKSLMVGLFVFS